jgi:hypothetical protein
MAEHDVEKEVKPFLQNISYVLRAIELKILKHENLFNSLTAKVFAGTASANEKGMLLFMTLSRIVGAVTLILINKHSLKIKTYFRPFTDFIDSFVTKMRLDLILLGHRILRTLFPQYRQIFEALTNAAAGVSQQLGLSLEFLPLLLMNAQAVAVSAAELVGVTPDEARMEFLSTSADWLNKLKNRFNKYAKRPAAILEDISNTIIRNSEQNAFTDMSTIRRDLDGNILKVRDFTTNLGNLTDDIGTLIEDLPDTVSEHLDAWWAPISASINLVIDDVIAPVLDKIDEVEALLDDFRAEQISNNARLALLSRNVGSGITAYLAADPDQGMAELLLLAGTFGLDMPVNEDTTQQAIIENALTDEPVTLGVIEETPAPAVTASIGPAANLTPDFDISTLSETQDLSYPEAENTELMNLLVGI